MHRFKNLEMKIYAVLDEGSMPYQVFLWTTNWRQLFSWTCDTSQWMICKHSPASHPEPLHQKSPALIGALSRMRLNPSPNPSGSNVDYLVKWFVGSFQGCWETVLILDGKAKSFACLRSTFSNKLAKTYLPNSPHHIGGTWISNWTHNLDGKPWGQNQTMAKQKVLKISGW